MDETTELMEYILYEFTEKRAAREYRPFAIIFTLLTRATAGTPSLS